MTHFDLRDRSLAICLSALAGYVDTLGFMATDGFFVSFMSGNSTRLGVGLAETSSNAAIAGALIVIFVLGVVTGSLLGRVAGQHHRVVNLSMIAVLLAAAAALGDIGLIWLPIAIMALTMGLENVFFEQNGDVRVGLTYMTGRLVKIGQRLAVAIVSADRWSWVPHLLLWIGLLAGGAAGAVAFLAIGLDGLWIAAGAAGLLALAVSGRSPAPGR